MAIDERSRHELFLKLEEVLGPEEATTLMEHLPPVGWADVATKRDLDQLALATKRDIDQLSGVTGWRLHDLRRTCVSEMARLGIAPHVADKILNHQAGTISGVAAVYQRHDFIAERREALEIWGTHVRQIIGDQFENRDLRIVA